MEIVVMGKEHNFEQQGEIPARTDTFLRKLSRGADRGLTSAFQCLGLFTARRPWLVICSCILFTGLCCVGFINFATQTDGAELYTPTTAQSRQDKKYVQLVFGNTPDRVTLLAVSSGTERQNILTKQHLLEFERVFHAITSSHVGYRGKTYQITDFCIQEATNSTCVVNTILSVWSLSRNKLETDPDIVASINNPAVQGSYGQPLNLAYVLGGMQRDNQGRVVYAEALQMIFSFKSKLLDIDKATYDAVLKLWEEAIVRIAVDEWQSSLLKLYISDLAAVDRVSQAIPQLPQFHAKQTQDFNYQAGRNAQATIDADISILSLGYILIVCYTLLTLWRNSWAYQKVHLAFCSIFGICMGIATTLGLVSGTGVKFNLVTQALPYLLIGLGVDDTFVIIGSYFHQNPNQPVPTKVGEALGHSGASIAVTSMTSLAAFAIGVYTSLPALRDFSIYATVGITSVFLYQVTFLAAWLALDARREQRVRLGAPGAGLRASRVMPTAETTPTSNILADLPTTTPRIIGRGTFDPAKPTMATVVVARWLPLVSLHPMGKLVILLIEVGLLAGGIYGCTKVKTDFRYREWFVPKGSYLHGAFAIQRQYFGGEQTPWAVYTKGSRDGREYFFYQDAIVGLLAELRNSRYVAALPAVTSWYEAYLRWLATSSHAAQLDERGRPPSAAQFNAWLQEWLAGPGSGFAGDVLLRVAADGVQVGPTVVARGASKDIVDSPYAVRMMKEVRRIAVSAAGDLQAFAYDSTFQSYDGYDVITWQTIRNIIIAGTVVFGMMLLLLADLGAALLVASMVALCDVMLLGFMWYVDLTFNTVTSIVLVLAVGIAVDYPAHIMRSYLSEKGTYHDRALKALQDIGGEVLSGALTTWLGIVVMGAAVHYIFRTFFKLFFALIALAIWHGIVFMPVLLSIWGPASYAT